MSMQKICIDYTIGTFNLIPDVNTTGVISVQPIFDSPYLRRIEVVGLNKQFMCGAIAAIVKELVIKQKSSIEVKKAPISEVEFVEGLLADIPQIILMSATASQVVIYKSQLSGIGISLHHTVNVDYFELGNIAYTINSGSLPFLGYFHCFQRQVWHSIALAILIISFLTTLLSKNYFNFFTNLWTIYVLLFSKTIPLTKISIRWSQTILLGSWLLSVSILSIYFSGNVLDFMVKAIPKTFVDSWDDLYERHDIRIMASEDSPMTQFARSGISEMAISFNRSLDPFPWENMYDVSDVIYKNLISGRSAFVRKKMSLIYEVKRIGNSFGQRNNIFDEIYISRDGGGYIPYFIPVSEELGSRLKDELDKLVATSRESGLFLVWIKEAYLLNNLSEVLVARKVNKDIYEYKDISLHSLADVFVLMAYSFAALFAVFVSELIYKYCKCFAAKPEVQRRRRTTHFYNKSFHTGFNQMYS